MNNLPANRRPSHIPGIDGLRAAAILMVMAYHYMGFGPHRNPLINAFFAANRSGWIGVDLFFVISGFLVTGILLDARGTRNYFRNFYARRTLRIFPLYYAVLAGLFLLPYAIKRLQTDAFHDVASRQGWLWLYGTNILNSCHNQLLFGKGWIQADHFWSLAVEEQFYLIWPPIVFLLGRRWLAAVCLAFIALAPALRTALVFGGHAGLAPYMLTPCRLDTLACGAALAVIFRSTHAHATIARIAFATCIVTGLILCPIFLRLGGLEHDQTLIQTIGFTILAIFFAAVVGLVAALPADHRAVRLLELPVLKSIGKYSYAIYVFHWLLFPALFQKLLPPDWTYAHLHYVPGAIVRYLTFASLSYFVAVLSWHAFEKHFLKLKRFFESRPESSGAAAASSLPDPQSSGLLVLPNV